MTKVEKDGGGEIDKLLNQRISGLIFVNPNIPSVKYGRDMEIEAVNNSFEFMKGKRKGIKLSECGSFGWRNVTINSGQPRENFVMVLLGNG